MARLKLLPLPKRVRQGKGSFRLEDDVPVIVGPGEDRLINAAWSFAGEAERKADIWLPVERMARLDGIGRRVLFLLAGRHETLYPGLEKLSARLKAVPASVRDQAYALKVTSREAVAVARTPQGLYYAAQTLRQLLTDKGSLPCVSIVDWPTYSYRGVMLDISRFKVPTLASLFERIERLASLKINVFQLYTEHTFAFRRHPEIGRDCGSMSAEDIIELDAFCKEHFVDLNANLQSFGHHRHLLSIPKYNDLAEKPDQPWTLCPVDSRTYELLDDLYAECLPAYSSGLFNASCDETWDLGLGRSAGRVGRIGIGRVYLGHIKKIERLARKYGKRMMIWGDIVLKHPECIPDVPDDVIMLDWSYGAGGDLRGLKRVAAAGLEHWSCPGTSTWTRLFADVENACGNIAERAVAGQRSGATGLLNTDWGDGGHPQMPANSYHAYAFGAEQGWTPKRNVAGGDFDRRFAWAWFGDGTGLFGRLYREVGRVNRGSWLLGWKGPRPFRAYWATFPGGEMLGRLTPAMRRQMGSQPRRVLELVASLAETYPEHHDVLRQVLFAVGQVVFTEKKIGLAEEIKGLWADGKRRLPAGVKKRVRGLLSEWKSQRAEFEELWVRDHRRSEIAYRLGEYRKRAGDYRRLLK